ncbi:arrestin [Periconia macrospinosa]|uniref:Arrestin n=1 Tax=Periconia macrospinosa TaxID=97972 RepID=A0A2V1EBE0_9PLEO|nr:arrestin [Periconia macrospinosa]
MPVDTLRRPSRAGSIQSNAMQSITNHVHYRVLQMANLGQPLIEINLDDTSPTTPRSSYVISYATMDTIEGTVNITAQHDTRFEDIEIAFNGVAHISVERFTASPSMSGRTESVHRFLSLRQPIDDSDLPTPRVLVAGKKYTFPFIFTVPQHLLPRACTHKVVSDHVRACHLQLPPSIGDPELAGFGGTLLDDMAPEMTKIVYGIKVRIMHLHEADGKISVLGEKMRKVRVKPIFEEQPPLNIEGIPEYRERHEKTIKKSLFKGKSGTLTAQSMQPKPLIIPGARTVNYALPSTRAMVLLRFDPAEPTSLPPRLGQLKTHIKVSTFYAVQPRQGIPSRSQISFDVSQGVFAENISISNMCVASAQWTKHSASESPIVEDCTTTQRRDSGTSDSTIPSPGSPSSAPHTILTPSRNYQNGDFWTASIIVPISMPSNKNFIPTFHSCLVSRMYTLIMSLSVHAPGVSDPTLTMRVPLQVCAQGSVSGNENARARSAEVGALEEARRMFSPRSVILPPPPPSAGADAPPEYVPVAPRAGRHNARVTVVGGP